METRITGSKDIIGPRAARAYLKRRMVDAVACWKGLTQAERDSHHVVSFARYLARYW